MFVELDDLVPVKDEIHPCSKNRFPAKSVNDKMDRRVVDIKGANLDPVQTSSTSEQRNVGKWTRGELEDRYFCLYDESLILKKHGRKQEDKIKRLTTKLLKLISDRKKLEQENYKDGNARKRDIETEQLIEEMQDRIRELERNNRLLHEKLIVSRQQLAMQLKRPVPSAYRHISSRLDTGIPKLQSKIPGSTIHGSGRESRSPYIRYVQSPPVENAKIEANMDETVALLRRQINAYEQELQSLKDLLHVKEIEHDEELVAVKSQLTQDQRQLLQENISVIRLQRELKQRASQLVALESHCSELNNNLEASRQSHEQVLSELDLLGQELKNEQQRYLSLQDEMRILVSNNLVIAELKEKNSDLENENKILKESNNVLLNSALNSGNKENSSGITHASSFKSQLEQLETALKYVKEENDSLMKAKSEQDKELQQLRVSYSHLEEDYTGLKCKLKLFNKDNELNLGELEEALCVISRKKEKAIQTKMFPDQAVEQENLDLLKQQFLKAQADHVETINELEKTRNMLVAQHRINQEYQLENENVSKKLANAQREYECQISDQAHLLQQQETSIQQLKEQLKSFDSNQHKLNNETDVGKVGMDVNNMNPGEHIFGIHLHSVEFARDIFDGQDISNVSTFVSWTFYIFGLQTTPALQGVEPKFDFISHYAVRMDESFLDFIAKKKVTFKIHRTIGLINKAFAVGEVALQEMLLKPEDYIRKKVPLIEIGYEQSGTSFGFLDVSLNLNVAAAHALQFKDLSIAQGSLQNSSPKTLSVLEDVAFSKMVPDEVNDLHIKIIRCNNIQSRVGDVKPSAYCVYKFNSKPDHATDIIHSNSNPEFNDHMSYNCEINLELSDYIKTQALEVYVFDDNDPKLSAYLGMASIPLFQLTKNKAINGEFDLKMANGNLNGNVEISVSWQFAYNLSRNMTTEQTHIEDKLPVKNVKQNSAFPPKPMPRTLIASQYLNDTFEKTDKKPPLFPRDTRKHTTQQNASPTSRAIQPEPIKESHQFIIENSTASSSLSESSSDSESEAVIIATGSNKLCLGNEVPSIESKEKNIKKAAAGLSMEFGDDDSDSEIVVSANTDALLKSNIQSNYNIIILVSHLKLFEHAPVLKDDKVQMLFVEYRFLDFSPEELETPFALPKPKPNQRIVYNFRKVFEFNPEKSVQRRQYLSKMISSPSKSRLKFTVVSEPLEDNQSIDCEDVGYSYVDINKILRNRKNIIEEDIGVYDASNPTLIIGHLNITIKALSVLQSL